METAGLLAWWEFAEALHPLPNVHPSRCEGEHALGHPSLIIHPFIRGAFEGVHAQVFNQGQPQLHEGLAPNLESDGVLPEEADLPVVVAQRRNATIVGPVEELFT